MANDLKVSFNSKNKTLNIVARAPTPQGAQKLAQAAIEEAAALNSRRLQDLERMKKQFELAVKRERDYDSLIAKLTQQLVSSHAVKNVELAQSLAQIMDAVRTAQSDTNTLAQSLKQQQNFDLLQKPTLPTQKSEAKKALIAMIAALASGTVLLLFVFVKQALVNASRDEESAAKMKLLKDSWSRVIGRSGMDA
jgi:hypothetical protein